jgi:hypothetical protein
MKTTKLEGLSPNVTRAIYLDYYVEALLIIDGKLPEERLMLAHLLAMDYQAKTLHNVDGFSQEEIDEEIERCMDEEATRKEIYKTSRIVRFK